MLNVLRWSSWNLVRTKWTYREINLTSFARVKRRLKFRRSPGRVSVKLIARVIDIYSVRARAYTWVTDF